MSLCILAGIQTTASGETDFKRRVCKTRFFFRFPFCSQDLLERIESQVALAEKEEIEHDLKEANEEPVGNADQLISSWDGEYSRPPSEGGVGRINWQPPERAPAAAVRNKLGGFFSGPRRLSNCFGQRLDRIGSVSGLGCNRRHVSCNLESSTMSVTWLGGESVQHLKLC